MIHFIDRVLEPSLWFLADWSLRWAMLIVVLAVWLLFVRPRRSATRYLLCLLVLLAGLVLPALPRWGTEFAIATGKPDPPALAADLPQVPAGHPPPKGLEAQVSVEELAADRPADDPTPAERPSAHRSGGAVVLPSAAEPLGTRRIIVLSLAILWSCGAAFLWARRLGGWLLLGRMRRTAVPLQGPPLEMLRVCRAQLALGRQATLASHEMVRSPFTLGLHRLMILVPPSWTELPEHVQRGSLLHELAHLARYDDWLALALEMMRVVFFFHPFLHWLLGRIEYERELLCDEMAIAQGINLRDYAGVLLEFTRRAGRLQPAFFGSPYPLGFGHRRTVKARIHRLLETNMNRWMSPLPAGRALALGTVALALALALGSFGARAVEPQANPQPPTAEGSPTVPLEDANKAKAGDPEVTNRIEPYSVLKIGALGADPAKPIVGPYLVEPSGKIDLGPAYGKVRVAGLTFEEAELVVVDLLKKIGVARPAVSLTLAGWVTKWSDDPSRKAPYHIKPLHLLKVRVLGADSNQPLDGEYLVEPGGKLSLGPVYGRVAVAGLTLEEAQKVIENHLKKLGFAVVNASVTLAGWEHDWQDLTKQGAPQDAKKSSKAEPQKKSLGYGGKSFAEWRAVLTDDLKPEVRIEAIKALGAFAANGYGKEAARAIIESMRGYDSGSRETDDGPVIGAANYAFRKIGSEGVPALTDEMKNGKTNGRRFAITALGFIGPDGMKAAAPAIIEACKDTDFYIRVRAIGHLDRLQLTPNRLVLLLTEALKDENPGIRVSAANRLRSIGQNAKPAVPALIAALKDDIEQVRGSALQALQAIGPKVQEVLPLLLVALKDKGQSVRLAALEYVKALGPEAKEAVPALITAFKESDANERVHIAGALGSIGPAAKEALPTLIDFLDQPQNKGSNAREAVQDALRKISK